MIHPRHCHDALVLSSAAMSAPSQAVEDGANDRDEGRQGEVEIQGRDGPPILITLRGLMIAAGILCFLPRQVASGLMAFALAGVFHLWAKRRGELPPPKPKPSKSIMLSKKLPPEPEPGKETDTPT